MTAANRNTPATRPVFVPCNSAPWVESVEVSVNSRYVQRSEMTSYIKSWHETANVSPILECSSVSPDPIGKTLSAFNLTFDTPSGRTISVECAYQGSKVFTGGGPYHDLYGTDSRSAKKDRRCRESGQILGFKFFNRKFGLKPQNSFFNWLYLSALVRRHPSIIKHLGKEYEGFTDVFRAFGMDRACQAESVAMAVGLERAGVYNPDFISKKLISTL